MRRMVITLGATLTLLGAYGVGRAHDDTHDLPAGPIRQRHELMEGIGKSAKVIGEALKSGNLMPVAGAASDIQARAEKILPLFPLGSLHEKSRAKAEIWSNWAEFESSTKKLGVDAGALAATAKGNGDVGAAAKTMFSNCKSCHDKFRVPDKK